MVDVIGHGWSPAPRTRAVGSIVLGTLLLLSPAYLGLLGIGHTGYHYETATVTAVDGDLRFEGRGVSWARIEGIDCATTVETGRLCALERRLIDESVTVERAPFERTADPYAEHGGRLYRRTSDGDRMGLEPVSPETVLDHLAVSEDRVSPLGRLALWRGSLTTTVPIAEAGRIVETSDGYVVIYEHHTTSDPILDDPLFVAIVTIGAVYGGFRLLWPGILRWETLN
ncbi:hypothetical protein SAMN05216559_1271 [Halomicrobium zhouii]|uniref:Uncharacterized protein n=1 Tax=Halomicrobium zhouii TaxID=767519 RepID=A0A1I6KQ05_9EURY|nr:hypothetical protein [Halomicrobium zhouii]SFR93325.1 hypothetical protein SAMN05216559_1271 [Halomicrobium zhouii]